MEKVRIGIIGAAQIAEKYILPSLAALRTEYKINEVASRNHEKARDIAQRYDALPFNNYEELVNSDLIDAVYIPLPNSLHHEWILKSLENGKHVLVEKSLTCSLTDTLEVMNKAREKKLVVMENFQFRFHSQLKYILDLVNNDEIGQLRSIRSSFGFPPFGDGNNIRYQKELGGGALLDAGAYPVKISQFFLGEDIEVKSSKLYFDEKLGVDLWGGAFLTSRNAGLFSEIAFGFDNFYQCNLELWGSKGKITAERIFTAPPGFKPSLIIEKPNGKVVEELPADNNFINMLKYFHKLIIENNYEEEIQQNISQSRLLEEIRNKNYE